jgi:hypothetical protein
MGRKATYSWVIEVERSNGQIVEVARVGNCDDAVTIAAEWLGKRWLSLERQHNDETMRAFLSGWSTDGPRTMNPTFITRDGRETDIKVPQMYFREAGL